MPDDPSSAEAAGLTSSDPTPFPSFETTAPLPFVPTANRPPAVVAPGPDGLVVTAPGPDGLVVTAPVSAPEVPEVDATEVEGQAAEVDGAETGDVAVVDALAVEAATLAGVPELARWSRGETFSALAADARELADKGGERLARHRSLLVLHGFSA